MRATPTLLQKNLAQIAANSLTVNSTGTAISFGSAGSTGAGGFMMDVNFNTVSFSGGQLLLITCAVGSILFDARL